jgi:hypothetical protein
VTRTEDRLADALAAVARGVEGDTLPPLRAGAASRAPQRWRRWLAPLAAAASVTLIVVLASVVHLLSGKPPGRVAPVAGPPRYYVSVSTTGVQVRNTATGVVTDRIPTPFIRPGLLGAYGAGVAAGDGGREFVVGYTPRPHIDYTPSAHVTEVQVRLFSFHLTGTGRVAGLSLVRGGPLHGVEAGSGPGALAVSPDGSKVALAIYRPLSHSGAEIVVINLRTGARVYWAGGLRRADLNLGFPSISWTPGGDSLVFLTQWCHSVVAAGFCANGFHAAEVRELRVTTAGGRLSASSILLRESARYPNIVQALLTPDGKALTMVLLDPPYLGRFPPVPQDLRVIQAPLTGGQPRLLYHGVTGPHAVVSLGSDASGRHLLLTWRLNGWIDHGRLRSLAPPGRVAVADAW